MSFSFIDVARWSGDYINCVVCANIWQLRTNQRLPMSTVISFYAVNRADEDMVAGQTGQRQSPCSMLHTGLMEPQTPVHYYHWQWHEYYKTMFIASSVLCLFHVAFSTSHSSPLVFTLIQQRWQSYEVFIRWRMARHLVDARHGPEAAAAVVITRQTLLEKKHWHGGS